MITEDADATVAADDAFDSDDDEDEEEEEEEARAGRAVGATGMDGIGRGRAGADADADAEFECLVSMTDAAVVGTIDAFGSANRTASGTSSMSVSAVTEVLADEPELSPGELGAGAET
jgi:hypothetical protein